MWCSRCAATSSKAADFGILPDHGKPVKLPVNIILPEQSNKKELLSKTEPQITKRHLSQDICSTAIKFFEIMRPLKGLLK